MLFEIAFSALLCTKNLCGKSMEHKVYHLKMYGYAKDLRVPSSLRNPLCTKVKSGV